MTQYGTAWGLYHKTLRIRNLRIFPVSSVVLRPELFYFFSKQPNLLQKFLTYGSVKLYSTDP